MARAQKKILCDICEMARIDVGSPFCGSCGHPTQWASHDDRVEWELGQWRKTRARSSGGREPVGVAAVAAMERAAVREPDSTPKRNVITLDLPDAFPEAHVAGPSLIDRIVVFVRRLREALAMSLPLPLDGAVSTAADAAWNDEPAADASESEPVALHIVPAAEPEPVAPLEPEAPRVDVSEAPGPVAEAPAVATEEEKPVAPRKRPNRPTNKDLLKRALDVLTKVEQRLEHLEREVSEIDGAVRVESGPVGSEEFEYRDYAAY
jgi:hypothetical protein